MYSPRFDVTTDTEEGFRVYVDSVRIFDPMGKPDSLNETVKNAYLADGEYAPNYLELRDTLLTKNAETGKFEFAPGSIKGDNQSLFLDGQRSELAVEDFIKNGPKNEVYLAPGQAIAFNVKTATRLNLASIQVGMRLADGSKGNATVSIFNTNQNQPKSVVLKSATEQFYSIDPVVVWSDLTVNTLGESVYETRYPIVIMNTSDSEAMISLTSLKWGYTDGGLNVLSIFGDEQTPALAMAAMARMSANPNPVNPIAPENVAINVPVSVDTTEGKGTITITTQPEIASVIVNGESVTDCEMDIDGNKCWTYEFDATEPGDIEFTVVVVDSEGNASEEIAVATTITGEKLEDNEPDNGVTEDGSDNGSTNLSPDSFAQNILKGILSIFTKLFELLFGGAAA
mgnify:CR=1 FL=1